MYDEDTPPAKGDQLTADGILLGTPDYMAPEQARDPRSSDIRADIYSLGCVLYQLLSGQVPFLERNLIRQLSRHATETPKPLSEFHADIPEGLEQIVSWMMAKKPEQRYATPLRAAQALEIFLLAGHEPAAEAEAPQLRSFLTWLETESPGVEPAPMEPPVALAAASAETHSPAQTLPPEPVAVAPMAPPKESEAPVAAPALEKPAARLPAEKKERKTKDIKPAEAAPVEPEPQPAPQQAGAPWRRLLAMPRRDWILIGIGSGVGVSACILGELLVLVLRWLFGGSGQ
jgi:hypothetical protein